MKVPTIDIEKPITASITVHARSALRVAVTATAWSKAAPASHGTSETFSTGSQRSEEHTSELPSLLRISYAVFCLKKKKQPTTTRTISDLPQIDETLNTTHLP